MNARGIYSPLLCAAVLVTAGCGIYSFSGTSLPSHIKTIAVPFFENSTLEYDVANQVTETITQKFVQDHRLSVVGEGRADCVLEGKITGYENKVHNYSAGDTPEDYIVVLRVSATLRDAVKGRDLWQEENLTVSAVYSATAGGSQALSDEASARSKAINDLAEDVLARTMEQW
jgi:hypothetical protein